MTHYLLSFELETEADSSDLLDMMETVSEAFPQDLEDLHDGTGESVEGSACVSLLDPRQDPRMSASSLRLILEGLGTLRDFLEEGRRTGDSLYLIRALQGHTRAVMGDLGVPKEEAPSPFEGSLCGTTDRGDGKADLQVEPQRCLDRERGLTTCGGDTYCIDGDTWGCSDCASTWDNEGVKK